MELITEYVLYDVFELETQSSLGTLNFNNYQ